MLNDPVGASPDSPIPATSSAPPQSWRQILAPYAQAQNWRGVVQLLSTALPYFALVAALVAGLAYGIWAALLLAVPAALFLVRLFMIQHDCGHGSFFRSRWANDLLGHALGVLTLTPYADWRRAHATHHATTGNLNRRGVGDITTLTVREYLWRSKLGRAWYRLYRHPLMMFGVGPSLQFMFRHRIPAAQQMSYWPNWLSALGTNAAVGLIIAVVVLTLGLRPLIGLVPVVMIAASVGVWLFYIQHQFEETYWQTEAKWDFHAASLKGSSYYHLPRVLDWLTAHIGFHHIHHLSSKVPNYLLRRCHLENPALWQAKKLGLRESLKCVRLALWDEDAQKLVPFTAVKAA